MTQSASISLLSPAAAKRGDVTTEAKASYDYLRLVANIPDERLKLEVQGTSTYESLAAASRFLSQSGLTDVLLVTDPYHARRSELVAREVGLQADAVTTDADSSLYRLVRESAAVAVGRIIGFRRLERFAVGWVQQLNRAAGPRSWLK